MKKFLAWFFLRIFRVLQRTFYDAMTRLYAIEMKSEMIHYGDNVRIYYPFTITGMSHLDIGTNVHINRGAFIKGEGGLKIHDNVHIGPNLLVYTVNHNYRGDALPYDSSVLERPVVIGKNVWIGANVTIVPGATIGDGAIIGAGSVIAGDVPRLAIVGSSPVKVLKYRDQEHYDRLELAGQYGGVSGTLYSKENY